MDSRTVARLLTALGLAAAVALGTVETAGAQPRAADGRVVVDDAQQAAAPTANLGKLANAIGVTSKGLYLRATAPAGLNVGPIEISIQFGAQRYTRTYDNARGTNDLLSFPPLTGAARREYWSITLTERVPGGPHHHAFGSQIDVVPLYTVTTSDLYFATAGCDPANGYADPTILWVDPAGVQRRIDEHSIAGGYDDQVHAQAFRETWTGVDVNRGLTAPTIEWVDRDPGGIRFPRGHAVPRGPRLLPFPAGYPTRDPVMHEVQDTLDDLGGDCQAQVRYFITWAPEPPAI